MMRNLMFLALLASVACAQNTAEVQTKPSAGIPQMKVPALTFPGGPAPQGGPAESSEGHSEMPEFEFTAVEVMPQGGGGDVDEKLKPFASMLEKMAQGAGFRVVSQESKQAPMKTETDWVINGQYSAHVLPIQQLENGAIRLDARVAMNTGGQTLNALRAEGEVPPRKVMAFRGLDAGNGNELILLLRQAPGDDEGQGGDGDSQGEQQEEQPGEGSQAEQQDAEKKEQQEEQGEQSQEKKEQMAKQEESQPDEKQPGEEQPQDDQTIEALLESLEQEDARQQQDARFDRSSISIPANGDWW